MSKPKKYDFSGWATRFGIKCSDGRTITNSAFDDCDGQTVPIVYSHNHEDIEKVLGHALLEKRNEGIYCYGSFNSTDKGKHAKELVNHGDITSLSIYANNLKQDSSRNVLHGKIREVSLVLAGANPGAKIDFSFAHSDDMDNDILAAAIFNPDGDIELFHEESIETPEEDSQENNEKEEPVVNESEVLNHAEEATEESGETLQDIYNTMTDKQQKCCAALVGLAVEEAENNKSKGGADMKQSAFENENNTQELTLSHDDMKAIMKEGQRLGTLNAAVNEFLDDEELAHGGITNIDYFFPDPKFIGKVPEVITDDEEWASIFLNGAKKSPISRVKTIYVDVRQDRAHGYKTKGSQKSDDTLAALKRSTDPFTVYKLHKFDRDDIIDLEEGGFEAVAFVKNEMQRALRMEVAMAALVGDGRLSSANDKIDPTKIRPIYGDSNVYSIPVPITFADGLTTNAKAKQLIDDAIRARKLYKGTGNPVFFTTEDWLTEMLLIVDTNGHRMYKDKAELAVALRCSQIVAVPCMENVVRTAAGFDYTLAAIVVNPVDYNFGATKKGEVKLFEDFVLDYNKMEYLIETRKSGALIRPYSALVLEVATTHVEVEED